MTKTHEPFAPLAIEWRQDGATVHCTVKGRDCDCEVELVVGVVHTLDTKDAINDLAIEGGKLVIKAMTEIFEAHIDNPLALALASMAWTREYGDAVTLGWIDALTEANEVSKTSPAVMPDAEELGDQAFPDLFAPMLRPRQPPMMS